MPIHKWPIFPISALREKFNPRNINHMPTAKFSARLKLDENISFLDGHELNNRQLSDSDPDFDFDYGDFTTKR
ncbi:MAG: hypothetical protein P8Z73_13055, partial [Desulfobacteraceae bacterium]